MTRAKRLVTRVYTSAHRSTWNQYWRTGDVVCPITGLVHLFVAVTLPLSLRPPATSAAFPFTLRCTASTTATTTAPTRRHDPYFPYWHNTIDLYFLPTPN